MSINRYKRVLFAFNLLICGGIVASNGMQSAVAPSISDQTKVRFQQNLGQHAQHFAFICHAFISRTSKPILPGTSYSEKDTEIIKNVSESYAAIIDETRRLAYQDEVSAKKAIAFFYEAIKKVCASVGCNPFGRFSQDHTSPSQQVRAIKAYVDALEKRFNSIVPVAPFLTRAKNKLCYNFISTEVIPRALTYVVGPAVTIVWAARNHAIHSNNIALHPHNHPWNEYEEHQHNTGVNSAPPANLFERILRLAPGLVQDQNPCLEQGNICNGPQIPDIDPTTGKQRVEIDQNKKPALDQKGDPILRFKRQWSTSCKASDGDCKKEGSEKCYRYMGYKPLEEVFGKLAYACRPAAAALGFYLLGTYMREAQLPEYQNRIKLRQQEERKAALAQEMRTRKVCYEKTIGFNQIKGHSEIIDREMRMIVDYLRNPFRYQNSASGTRSLLLYGPPGTGKTLMARAIAKESGAPFIELDADDILSENAKEKIIATLSMAEQVAAQRAEKSAIIYIDEIDAVTGNRQNGTLDPQRSKALANLLTIFDGVEKRNPYVHIVIILATNHYKNLDPALLRPGRIDRKVLLALPGPESRREFFEDLLPAEHKGLTDWFVAKTSGCSGAQIVSILDSAQMIASYNKRSTPCTQDYESALQNSQAEHSAIPEEVQSH